MPLGERNAYLRHVNICIWRAGGQDRTKARAERFNKRTYGWVWLLRGQIPCTRGPSSQGLPRQVHPLEQEAQLPFLCSAETCSEWPTTSRGCDERIKGGYRDNPESGIGRGFAVERGGECERKVRKGWEVVKDEQSDEERGFFPFYFAWNLIKIIQILPNSYYIIRLLSVYLPFPHPFPHPPLDRSGSFSDIRHCMYSLPRSILPRKYSFFFFLLPIPYHLSSLFSRTLKRTSHRPLPLRSSHLGLVFCALLRYPLSFPIGFSTCGMELARRFH
jgi:hypothetical protein